MVQSISAAVEKAQTTVFSQHSEAVKIFQTRDDYDSSGTSLQQSSFQRYPTKRRSCHHNSLNDGLNYFARSVAAFCKFLASPGLLLLLVTLTLTGFAHMTSYILLPTLTEELHFGKELASRIIMVSAVCDTASRPVFGLIAEKLGRLKVLLLHSSFILAAATGVYAILSLSTVSLYVHGVVLGVFVGMYILFIVPLILECVSKEHVTQGTGLFTFIIAFGPAVGLYIMG